MQTIFVSGANKSRKQRVSIQWLRVVFRMKLATDEPRMDVARQLDHLHELAVRRDAAEHQPIALQTLPKLRIDLVTMAMAFADFFCATVNILDQRTRR